MLAASNMSRITLTKSSFSFGVSSHLVRGSLSFTRSSASIFSLFGFICVRQGNFANAVDTSAEFLILFLNRTAMVLCDEILPGFFLPWRWYQDTCPRWERQRKSLYWRTVAA